VIERWALVGREGSDVSQNLSLLLGWGVRHRAIFVPDVRGVCRRCSSCHCRCHWRGFWRYFLGIFVLSHCSPPSVLPVAPPVPDSTSPPLRRTLLGSHRPL